MSRVDILDAFETCVRHYLESTCWHPRLGRIRDLCPRQYLESTSWTHSRHWQTRMSRLWTHSRLVSAPISRVDILDAFETCVRQYLESTCWRQRLGCLCSSLSPMYTLDMLVRQTRRVPISRVGIMASKTGRPESILDTLAEYGRVWDSAIDIMASETLVSTCCVQTRVRYLARRQTGCETCRHCVECTRLATPDSGRFGLMPSRRNGKVWTRSRLWRLASRIRHNGTKSIW